MINDGLSRITKLTIKTYDQPEMYRISKWKEQVIEQSFPGFGLHFVADETSRAVRHGLLEHPRMPHEETLIQMEVSITSLDHQGSGDRPDVSGFQILDQVRKDGGYVLPQGMERVV